jgi:hypothetical protein
MLVKHVRPAESTGHTSNLGLKSIGWATGTVLPDGSLSVVGGHPAGVLHVLHVRPPEPELLVWPCPLKERL